jgi:hypothetical protein
MAGSTWTELTIDKMIDRIVMQEGRKYHPPDYSIRGMIFQELGIMFEAHDQLAEHSPDCEKHCVLGLFYQNHPL